MSQQKKRCLTLTKIMWLYCAPETVEGGGWPGADRLWFWGQCLCRTPGASQPERREEGGREAQTLKNQIKERGGVLPLQRRTRRGRRSHWNTPTCWLTQLIFLTPPQRRRNVQKIMSGHFLEFVFHVFHKVVGSDSFTATGTCGNIQARGGACRAAGGGTWRINSAVDVFVFWTYEDVSSFSTNPSFTSVTCQKHQHVHSLSVNLQRISCRTLTWTHSEVSGAGRKNGEYPDWLTLMVLCSHI